MQRSFDSELLDSDDVPPGVAERAHRALVLTHTLLGNRAAIVRALRRHPTRLRRLLDVGCGHGGLAGYLAERLSIDVVGVDLKPPATAPIPIMRADATRDALPEADVAISVCLAHHLTDDQLVDLIRNVGRSCPRFIILDLVRSRVPLTMFRLAAPFVLPAINVSDGALSIRRAFTPDELHGTVRRALNGAAFRHSVAPLGIRQIVDITYPLP